MTADGARLFSGAPRSVHVGVTHVKLNGSEYVRRMRQCKAWLSTTGPADLVGAHISPRGISPGSHAYWLVTPGL